MGEEVGEMSLWSLNADVRLKFGDDEIRLDGYSRQIHLHLETERQLDSLRTVSNNVMMSTVQYLHNLQIDADTMQE